MIRNLHIENYALIDQLDIDLQPGFSVITGETGAGKSIILGAIGLLMGQRVSGVSQRDDRKTVIEASFDVGRYNLGEFFDENDLDFDGTECVIRREITSAGKSRAFINDTPASLVQLKELGDKLLDVHSQHQNLLLNKENFQINILDILAGNEQRLKDYEVCFHEYKDTCKALAEATDLAEKAKADEDYIRFQVEQLLDANLGKVNQEELEQEAEILSHAEEIKGHLYDALQLLSSDRSRDTLQCVRECSQIMQRVGNVFPAAEELAGRLDSCYIELKDIADEIEGKADDVECNPKRLEIVNDRLNTIYSLQQKHHVSSIEELLEFQHEMEEKLYAIDNGDEKIEALRHEMEVRRNKVNEDAMTLSQCRQKAAREMEKQMVERLLSLGMPNVNFRVEFDRKEEPDASGCDKVTFMFSANKNMPLQNMSQVASGGEIARVMLSLKAMIAGAVKMPTIIFDEIDTGVSGSMAEKMARIMREMGDNERQVITITHLPQIAASGQFHYKVYKEDSKEKTTTHIVELDKSQRIEEIAHMLSGEVISQAALDNARELMGEGFKV